MSSKVDIDYIDGIAIGNTTLGELFAEVGKTIASDVPDETQGARVAIPMALYVTVKDVDALKVALADVFGDWPVRFTRLDGDDVQDATLYCGWGEEQACVETYEDWQEG